AAFGVLGLLVAGYFASSGWYLLTHKPCLVLGQDRLQFRLGKHVSWQVRYIDIADVALFVPVHPLGFTMPWIWCLGIRLGAAGCRRQWGFGYAIPMTGSCEPPERCLEAVLRCYHLFKAEQQPLR
ncbi:MAG TPA: hypothetical protein VG013_07985, partial [Gemmataceae bacterium]|nr:hypothetical protein [Gemmataceae bacterium]